jgi:hypothetical protein
VKVYRRTTNAKTGKSRNARLHEGWILMRDGDPKGIFPWLGGGLGYHKALIGKELNWVTQDKGGPNGTTPIHLSAEDADGTFWEIMRAPVLPVIPEGTTPL